MMSKGITCEFFSTKPTADQRSAIKRERIFSYKTQYSHHYTQRISVAIVKMWISVSNLLIYNCLLRSSFIGPIDTDNQNKMFFISYVENYLEEWLSFPSQLYSDIWNVPLRYQSDRCTFRTPLWFRRGKNWWMQKLSLTPQRFIYF